MQVNYTNTCNLVSNMYITSSYAGNGNSKSTYKNVVTVHVEQ